LVFVLLLVGEEDFDGRINSDDDRSENVFNSNDRFVLELISVNIVGIAVAFK
jgi:hypothetical protein